MRVQLLSDLHLEFYDYQGRSNFYASLDSSNVDVLLLCGDICSLTLLEEVMHEFAYRYDKILYVNGNHELYYTSPFELEKERQRLSGLSSLQNLTWLNNSSVVIDGIKFYGGTKWYPERKDKRKHEESKRYMGDFKVIKDLEPWVYRQHQEFVNGLIEARPDVVLSHHIPSKTFTPLRFKGFSTNHYFCTSMEEYAQEANVKYWFYGHTHDCQNTIIGNTNYICNPKAYPTELTYGLTHNPKLLIEI